MPHKTRSARLMTAAFEAQAAALATLGVRVPALLGGTMSERERTRMVSEKAEAMVESAQAVGRTAAALMLRQGGKRPTPASAFGAWLALAEAASRPYHARVKANARRLRKTSGKV